MHLQIEFTNVYIKVRKNIFDVRHIESDNQIQGQSLFTTQRLLAGEFIEAQDCLKKTLQRLNYGNAYLSAPTAIIHPLEMIEGGLSAVEDRIFLELAYGAGCKKVIVWVGDELNDDEVLEKIKSA